MKRKEKKTLRLEKVNKDRDALSKLVVGNLTWTLRSTFFQLYSISEFKAIRQDKVEF